MRTAALFSILLIFTACSNDTPENIGQKINQLIGQDDYEQALQILDEADSTKTTANLALLREKVHLNYGIFLEYRGREGMEMRERMTGALRQYIKTLKINPNNQKARAEITQIMSIYATMPQSPGEKIINDLQELGFEFKAPKVKR